MARFDGKRIVVTGAGSGFGAAIARRFAAEGGRVLAADIDGESAQRTVSEIEAEGGVAVVSTVNVAEEDQVASMIEQARSAWDGLDVLVNNAGYSHRQKLMWKLSVEEFDAVFSVNVRGVFLGCKHAVPVMIEGGGGVIINIASVGAIAPRPGVTPYNATKGAVLTMTKGLALEVARHNIRCNAINPVASATGFMKTATGQDELSDELEATLISTIPRGRLATPADIAASATFLASDDADFITGTAINVDGGRSV